VIERAQAGDFFAVDHVIVARLDQAAVGVVGGFGGAEG
jgi:hypothetical protein